MKKKKKIGLFVMITGCMFSGKTVELIRRVKRAEFAKQRVLVFKPVIDNRYSTDKVVSHDKCEIEAIKVRKARQIRAHLRENNVSVVGIDEVQFFDNNIVTVIKELLKRGINVIAAGLNRDFRNEPFGPMSVLMVIADEVYTLTAVCMQCGDDAATRTQRLVDGRPAYYASPVVMIGGTESYEARCRNCHEVPGEPE